MLVNKEDMTVAELRGFLQSYLRERNSSAALNVSQLISGKKLNTTAEKANVNKKHQSKKTTVSPLQDPPANSTEQITKLIGRKALTKYILNGLAVALVDTGAQVSIRDRAWKDTFLTLTFAHFLSS